jgi:hypothetical protein
MGRGRWSPVLGTVLMLVLMLGACGGDEHRLVIEFFDPSTEGITRQDGRVTVDGAFEGQPLVVITEADIASWDPEGVWGHCVVLVRSGKTSELGSLVRSGVKLVFRLSINDDSFWGYLSVSATAVLGDPSLVYEGYFSSALESVFYLGSRSITIDGVALVEAARQAWSD